MNQKDYMKVGNPDGVVMLDITYKITAKNFSII